MGEANFFCELADSFFVFCEAVIGVLDLHELAERTSESEGVDEDDGK